MVFLTNEFKIGYKLHNDNEGVNKVKAIGYVRVSTEDQAREGVSIENQIEKIKAYAVVKDLELVDIIEDAGKSGKDLEREGMRKALEALESGEASSLIVYKLDRLTRSTKDLLNLVYDLFIPSDIALHSISENLDTTTANGRFFLTMLGGIATWERETISERTKDALAHKKVNGQWVGRIPFGFKIENHRLVEEPAQMLLIQKAKRMKRSGKSFRTIAATLNISKSLLHRAVNVNLRTVKAQYSSRLA
jgi:site-specific DNA recombinase